MYSGFYTAASGILTRQREIDVIANNLTNINTPGYKAERAIIGTFEQALSVRQDRLGSKVLSNSLATSAIIEDVATLYHDGYLKSTDRNLDVAITGEGFFEIQDDGGNTFFTRNGQFNIDEEGYLVLPNIGRVQGERGDIKVNTDNISIADYGTIFDADGTMIDRIRIAIPNTDAAMVRYENAAFGIVGNNYAYANTESGMIQGNIEVSNVDSNIELTTLIEAQSGYRSASKALQTIDTINRKAVSQLGSLT